MRRYGIFVVVCFVVTVIASSAYSALRMNSRNFAILCTNGSLQEIRQALDSGAKPTEQVLISAAYSNPDPEVMKLLITYAQRYGLNLTKMPEISAGILNSAIRGGRPEVVRAVISFGMNVNAKDKNKISPLNEALRYGVKSDEPERHEIIRILREAGAKR